MDELAGIENDWWQKIEEKCGGFEREQIIADMQLLEGIAKDEANDNQQGRIGNGFTELFMDMKDFIKKKKFYLWNMMKLLRILATLANRIQVLTVNG